MSYRLRDFGSYTVGGRVHRVIEGEPREVNFTRSASYTVDPRGHFAVEHAYVQFFVPEERNAAPPVLLVHGGGMNGSTWETTPDGRPGWINLLVQRGYEVHVIDNVERGRSGFSPGLWEGEPFLRSQEEAWKLFRIGPRENFVTRKPFERSLFPVDNFDAFARMQVPRWLSTTSLQVTALVEALKRIGPAIVVCHSQGGEVTLDAMALAPTLFTGLIALEPSATPSQPNTGAQIPTVLFMGDNLDAEPHWVQRRENWRRWNDHSPEVSLIESGINVKAGHSHLPMLDLENENALCGSSRNVLVRDWW